jgi:flagellar hook-associated protein 3 FlgL
MRITSFTIFNQLTRALSKNLRALSRHSDRLSSGKMISKPSDDVSIMSKSMDYKVTLNEMSQYKKNIDEVDAHLSYADSIMSAVTNVLTRSSEIAVQGSSGILTDSDRRALANEIEIMRDEIASLSNSKYRSRYLFSGFSTDTEAFDAGYNYQGNSGEIKVPIDYNSSISLNIPGDSIFGDGVTSIMGIMDQFNTDLLSGNMAGIQGAIDTLDSSLDSIADVRAELGVRLRYLDDQRQNLDNRDFNIQTLLSNTEDADIAQEVGEITKTELALEALRAAGAKSFSQSLWDFIR